MLLFLFAFLSSCKKENMEIFYWDETSCSDPWQAEHPVIEEEKIANIKLYLSKEDISVEAIHIEFDSSKTQLCQACNCTTGNVIGLKVLSKYKEKMEQLNFYQ